MDRRWPWKKKSSDKTVLEKVAAQLDSAGASNQPNQVYVLYNSNQNRVRHVSVSVIKFNVSTYQCHVRCQYFIGYMFIGISHKKKAGL